MYYCLFFGHKSNHLSGNMGVFIIFYYLMKKKFIFSCSIFGIRTF